ncbi:DUF1361 domain-containing protein [Ichthyenterobacterium sp. W332]|uniref:DUF1361 domain-containing protein n=1 Tax=Microcosmobacter mediterraneus TaxID=3075607 RepID=A0ABU2YMU8_9FLAO|nr:DUF1361 domain-containing protein [Ichthyenterobacterium sp. W332]MDT0559211.1 DUF1361 domain-containing protein [Ichthyenterobacterium sp. W332]
MNTIKTFINNRFKILSIVFVLMSTSLFLLMLRVKLTQSFFYLFLVWNLFLAIIPYAISIIMVHKNISNKLQLFLGFGVWLAFLPNAPYIITDLWHLRLASSDIFWLDIIVVSSFAANGLLLFYLSLHDMLQLLNQYLQKVFFKVLPIILILLSSFGIYLGRFLRYNSWEILSNPKVLFTDTLLIFIKPSEYSEAWLFILIFSLFLYIGYWAFRSLFSTTINQ